MRPATQTLSKALGYVCLLTTSLLVAGDARAIEPGEVSNLAFAADGETLSWDIEPLAASYNVYRGYVRDLSNTFYGTTFEAEVTGTTFADPTIPAPNQSFFYIVTADNLDGEGVMGYSYTAGGGGTVRANNYPWPGFAVAGKWAGYRSWPSVAIHSAVMHTGHVVTWQGGNPTTSYRWDPVTDQFDSQTVATNIFCSGHSFLPDGQLLVLGGNTTLFSGPRDTYRFDPVDNSWTFAGLMRKGRYYPTGVSVARGTEQLIVFSGNDGSGARNQEVEVYDKGPGGSGNTSWIYMTGANKQLAAYPTMHLLPSGLIFHSGPEAVTNTLDPDTSAWQFVANHNYGARGSGASVMLPPGHERIMILGGRRACCAGPATDTAEIIDFSAPSPAWSYTTPMHFKRMHANVVILPDGKVLVAGGGYDDNVSTYPAEVFDPATEQWTIVATMRSFRLYHSTSVLLPDARVMWAGSNFNPTAEFYSPGYLFRGARPAITSAPASVKYGNSFTIGTDEAAIIDSVVLIAPSAVTHSVNMSQRYVPLAFTVGSGLVEATAPDDRNVAPPGYYMLFILDTDGVPSKAKFLRLKVR